MSTMEQLRELRKSLPTGKKDPWGKCCPNKRVLLNRALKKDEYMSLTTGEKKVVNEFLEHCTVVKKENAEFEKSVAKIANL